MIELAHALMNPPAAYVRVQATAQPGAPGNQPSDPSTLSSHSAAAAAARTPPNTEHPVAPAAGAAGQSEAARTAASPSGHVAAASDNGGNLAGNDVPGGTNHAPATGPAPKSFSAPIKKD